MDLAFPTATLLAVLAIFLLGVATWLWALHRSHHHRVKPECRPYEVGMLPASVAQALLAHSDTLDLLGYEPSGIVEVSTGSEGDYYVALFGHPGTQDMAQVEVRASASDRPMLTFTTTWVVEKAIVTTNCPDVHVFGAIRGHAIVRLPALEDVARLHEVHRARVVRAMSAESDPPRGGRCLDRFTASLRRWGEVQVLRGNFYVLEGTEWYRLTWKGAWRHMRGSIPGAAARRRMRSEAYSNKEVERLGLAPRPSPRPDATAAAKA
jgi:hypothetical protein